MDIDQPLIGRSGYNQKSLCFVAAFKSTLPITAMKMGLPSLQWMK